MIEWHRRCGTVLCLAIAAALWAPPASAETADELLEQARGAYKQRGNRQKAQESFDLYEKAIDAGAPFDALWEGARAAFYLGEFPLEKASSASRLAIYDKGIAWAKRAATERPTSAEAHFWHGTMLGVWATARGILKSLSVSGDVRAAAERAIKINGRVECGGPYRLLGRYYYKLPGMFGGDTGRAVKLLEKAVEVCPTNDLGHLYLAEVLHELDRDADARPHLDKIIAGPPDPRWSAEHRFVIQKAKTLLDEL